MARRKRHYCPTCGTTVTPVKKFRVTVWERVVRCQDVEVLAKDAAAARARVQDLYAAFRDDEFPQGEWDEDRATGKQIYTGLAGRPRTGLSGSNELLGMEIEEEK